MAKHTNPITGGHRRRPCLSGFFLGQGQWGKNYVTTLVERNHRSFSDARLFYPLERRSSGQRDRTRAKIVAGMTPKSKILLNRSIFVLWVALNTM